MNISIFGLGIIGGAWAEHFHRDGDNLRGWNRTPKPVSYFVADARVAARPADVLIIVVADPPAVQNVLDQILPELNAGKLVIQSSTVSPAATERFAAQVAATGAAFLEAPFTGSKPAAEQRQMVFYTGGEPAILERARPILARLSRVIEHIGPIGSASAIKLALNMNIAIVAQALCESLTFARAAGIADEKFFAALRLNASHSGVAALKEPKLRAKDYAPQFSVKHMAKDLRLALETAGKLELPETQSVMKFYEEGIRRGWSEEDFIGLVRLLDR